MDYKNLIILVAIGAVLIYLYTEISSVKTDIKELKEFLTNNQANTLLNRKMNLINQNLPKNQMPSMLMQQPDPKFFAAKDFNIPISFLELKPPLIICLPLGNSINSPILHLLITILV